VSPYQLVLSLLTDPRVRWGTYVIGLLAVSLSIYSRDVSEALAWGLALFLAWRLWKT
jgi:hypothetical protein